jgi:hypothetical protein
MTRAEYESYIARHTSKAPVCSDAGEREASLHYDIMQDCKQLGWLALHGSMAHKSRRTPGEFDLIIICEYPRILFVECKSKTGKLSVEQQAIFAHVRRLGWEPHVVRSMSEWCVVRTIGSTAAERLLP